MGSDYGERALAVLVSIMEDEGGDTKLRLIAAKSVLEFGRQGDVAPKGFDADLLRDAAEDNMVGRGPGR